MIFCRGCGFKFDDAIDMFIHNVLERCDRDSCIEYMEQYLVVN